MRRRLLTVLLFLLCFSGLRAGAAATLAANDTVNLYGSLKTYLAAISEMPVDSINARLDVLIDSAADDDIRAGIAGTAFNYYLDSPVMGAEGVSVYIADNYFLNKRLKWPSDATWPNLYAFAEFNRLSLLGMEAQPLELESLDGGIESVREAAPGYKILYFYDDQCRTCSQQTPLISSFLENYAGEQPLTLYAVYTQSDRDTWARYAISHFAKIDNPKVRVFNLWDPEGESEFHKKYSVLTTPALFLLDADNRIIGRKLDASALGELLGQRESFDASLYSLMDNVRDNLGLDTLTVTDVCDAFAARIGNDMDLYRSTFYAIYNYLRSQNDSDAAGSAALVGQKYIIDRPDIWSPEFTVLVTEAVHNYRLNPVGTQATDVALRTRCGCKTKMLAKPGKNYTVLFFNLISCSDCSAWKQQLLEMKELFIDKGVRVVSVYVGPDKKEWKQSLRHTSKVGVQQTATSSKWWRDLRTDWPVSDLYQKYDVTTAPRLYLLDANGTVIAKDITPETLREILER